MRLTFQLLLAAWICSGQEHSRISLANANFASSIPAMVMNSGGTLCVAYRSFDRANRSSRLEISAFDVKTAKELQRRTITVPLVHSPRVADGLYLSSDRNMLAYVEAHEPGLVLLIATKDLAEIRRSEHVPFGPED